MGSATGDNLVKQSGESIEYVFDFTERLRDGDTLASGAAVSETPDGLTIATVAINTSGATTAKQQGVNVTVAQNKGVTCRISGGTDGQDYNLDCSCVTTNGDTLKTDGTLKVRD